MNGWKGIIATVSGAATLLGASWGGYAWMDGRYEQKALARQEHQETKMLYLRSEQRALERQKFELEVAKSQRPLTILERQRLQEIYEQLRQLDLDIQKLRE